MPGAGSARPLRHFHYSRRCPVARFLSLQQIPGRDPAISMKRGLAFVSVLLICLGALFLSERREPGAGRLAERAS